MNWIGQDQFGNYQLSGNLIKEFADDKVPKGYQRDWSQSHGKGAWNPFWVYSNEGLQLSSYCNWRFYYLDESYQKAFGGGGMSKAKPHRTSIYAYSDLGQSTVTGNQVTDLLREIPHDPSKMSYERRHILYLPICVDVMDIIETQLAENDGTLVNFAFQV